MVKSFNSLTVDDDMSTNDAVFALANGAAGNAPISEADRSLATFSAALSDLCQQLAKEVAADGEGATKLLGVPVSGLPSDEIAPDLARAVAGSNPVQAAGLRAAPH